MIYVIIIRTYVKRDLSNKVLLIIKNLTNIQILIIYPVIMKYIFVRFNLTNWYKLHFKHFRWRCTNINATDEVW